MSMLAATLCADAEVERICDIQFIYLSLYQRANLHLEIHACGMPFVFFIGSVLPFSASS